MSPVFADSSGWIALLSRDDQFHEPSLARYRQLSRERVPLVTNNYVVDETATRLRYGLGLRAALGFREMLTLAVTRRRLRIVWVGEKAEAEAWAIFEQYADVRLSLTDATCAVSARASRCTEVFGIDTDFEALGFAVRPGHA